MRREWVELDEFPDYAVSQLGEIVNMKTDTFRKYSSAQNGMQKISLYDSAGLLKTRSVAVIVAKAFCEPINIRCDTVIHLDGDYRNCKAENLAWRPRWFAIRFHKQFYFEAFHQAYAQPENIVELGSGREYRSIQEVCITEGVYCVDVYKSCIEESVVPVTLQEFRYF